VTRVVSEAALAVQDDQDEALPEETVPTTGEEDDEEIEASQTEDSYELDPMIKKKKPRAVKGATAGAARGRGGRGGTGAGRAGGGARGKARGGGR